MNKWIRFNQLWQLTAALFREIIREPGVLFWGILFPILMSLGLGIAFTKKADVLRKVAIINSGKKPINISDTGIIYRFLIDKCEKKIPKDRDTYNWKYVIKDEKLGNSIFLFYRMDWEEAMKLLKRGTINVLLVEKEGVAEYHFDPMNSDAQLT